MSKRRIISLEVMNGLVDADTARKDKQRKVNNAKMTPAEAEASVDRMLLKRNKGWIR